MGNYKVNVTMVHNLLAEKKALKSERDALRIEVAHYAQALTPVAGGPMSAPTTSEWNRAIRHRDEARAELTKVKAENAELLAAMEEAVAIGTRWWRMAYMNNVCAAIEGMRETLKRAIAKAKGSE